RQIVRRPPRFRIRLESTDDQPADFFLDVGVSVGVAQNRQLRMYAFDLIGNDVEMLRRMQRHSDPDRVRELFGPLPGAVHDVLRFDVTCVRTYAGDTPFAYVDPGHAGTFDDARAAHARTFGQRHRQIGRIRFAVARKPDTAGEIVD